MTLAERFWAKVQRGPECWDWTGARIPSGYGQVSLGGGRFSSAHRVSWELVNGSVPAGLELDHLCRNRLCVNPSHLEPVTRRENILRGTGMGARNARKIHCPQGHPYTSETTYTYPRGWRRCRICAREQRRAHYLRSGR